MYPKKRGMLLVYLVLSLVFIPAIVLGEGEVTYEAVHSIVNCENVDQCSRIREPLDLYCEESNEACSEDAQDTNNNGDGDCDPVQFPLEDGCMFYTTEYDGGVSTDSSCIALGVPAGFNIDKEEKSGLERYDDFSSALNARNDQAIQEFNSYVSHSNLGYDVASGLLLGSSVGAVATVALIGGLAAGPLGFITQAIIALISVPVWGWAIIAAGAVIGVIIRFATPDSPAHAVQAFQYANIRYGLTGRGLLCGTDKEWQECNIDNKDKLYWIDTIFNGAGGNEPLFAYKCTERSSSSYEWVLESDFDLDLDGYGASEDCMNLEMGVALQKGECPAPLEISEYQYQTKEQLRRTMRAKCDNDPRYSTCSSCINPGAPEICGDLVNNDCRGIGDFDAKAIDPDGGPLNALLGDTPDSCHDNKYACEQEEFPVTENNQRANRRRNQEEELPPPVFNNINDQKYSWVEKSSGGGFCCGYDGVENNGQVTENGNIEGLNDDYLCVTKKKTYTGYEGEEGNVPGWNEVIDRCGDDWCLIGAKGSSKFQVMTIKEFSEEPYDVVANGESWVRCEAGQENLPPPGEGLSFEGIELLKKKSNRFVCFKEGNKWSWAECAGETLHQNDGIKGRRAGEGKYTLPLIDDAQTSTTILPEREGTIIDINSGAKRFKEYYGDDYLFDFTDYNYLNFYVKYKNVVRPPVDIKLEILGKGGVEYVTRQVLGLTTNQPFTDNFMHVRVDLPENLKYVREVRISSENLISGGTPTIIVRNVYLSSDADEMLCSGEEHITDSSWLENVDQGNPQEGAIIGQGLCTALYGEKAWLGNDDEVDDQSANCCGNGEIIGGILETEYYNGDSRNIGDAPGKKYACWNSQPIATGETTMNLEFDVEYEDDEWVVTEEPELDISANFRKEVVLHKPTTSNCPQVDGITFLSQGTRFCFGQNGNSIRFSSGMPQRAKYCQNAWREGSTGADLVKIVGNLCQPTTRTKMCKVTYQTDDWDIDKPQTLTEFEEAGWEDKELKERSYSCTDFVTVYNSLSEVPVVFSNDKIYVEETQGYYQSQIVTNSGALSLSSTKIRYGDVPKKVGEITIHTGDFKSIVTDHSGIYTIESTGNENVEIYLFHPINNDDLGQDVVYNELNAGENVIWIMARVKDDYQPTPPIKTSLPRQISMKTYSCNKEECLFPLPGKPNYRIINQHPGLYDLYFVTGTNLEDEILITPNSNTFEVPGNVKAKKVAQQVLFLNDESGSEFYGCSAADLVIGDELVKLDNNLQQCVPKGDYTCAYSKTVTLGNQPVTTINVWDENVLPETMGVDREALKQDELVILEENVPANTLIHSTTVIPARNMLTNAEFCESCFEGNVLNGWEATENDLLVRNTQRFIIDSHLPSDDPQVTLTSNQVLKSIRIPVIDNMQIHYSINSTSSCDDQVRLFNDDGVQISQIALNSGLTFSTLTAAYLTYEISSCKFQQPSLQYVDDKGPVTFGFDEPKTKLRAAVSCCPENHCWDGTHCVAPMGEYTDIGINVGNERYYRCIEGDWTYLPKRGDWKGMEAGFCNVESQCFVMSSSKGSPENTAETFYQGKFPTCVENGDYIFDNYCDDGEWTSRTKFLASKMIDRTGGGEHSLFCTNFKDVLPILDDDQLGYLAGVDEGGVGIDGVPTTVCFQAVENDGFANKLITSKENTCINNACILQYNGKTAVATTLNRPIDHENSFTNSLNRNTVDCAGNNDFKDCERGLYHDEMLNSVWFTRDGLDPQQSVIENIAEFFRDLLTSETRITQRNLFEEVKNFNQVFSLKKDDKKVLAVQEGFGQRDAILVAEFEGFSTPICEYVKSSRIDREEFRQELLESVSGPGVISCQTDASIQKVEVVSNSAELLTGLNFLFPEITGKLRVS